jgi:hypothetical protein
MASRPVETIRYASDLHQMHQIFWKNLSPIHVISELPPNVTPETLPHTIYFKNFDLHLAYRVRVRLRESYAPLSCHVVGGSL